MPDVRINSKQPPQGRGAAARLPTSELRSVGLMPVLPNPKHERFCQELAKGTSAEKAYKAAGYKPNRGNAAVLKQKQSISGRVTEILAEREKIHGQATAKAVERAGLTKEWIIAKLVENAERALQAQQARDPEGNPVGDFKYEGSVANRALELLGKELGMFIERREVGDPGDFDLLDDDQLSAEMKKEMVALGLVKPRAATTQH